ncbi:SGNH/GDSL hydrolase family protein [Superficieibacter electus]|uniref:SGNH/GDSL hydrolase family protein n=1 Tax=Superficieibacter electus TaxID=2022662 RepID=UPI00159EE84A|nr:SGNH/GDSL hydrolase family protein [Superficieibacter electus]
MNNIKFLSVCRPLALLLSLLFILSCQDEKSKTPKTAAAPSHETVSQNQLTRFGDAGLTKLADKLLAGGQSVHILQLGDSHTAADLFTGQLRQRFQQRFGDGGPGVISPLMVPGQRSAVVGFTKPGRDWQLYSTRKGPREDFPFTGLIAQPLQDNADVTLTLKNPSGGRYQVSALYKSSADAMLALDRGSVQTLPDSQNHWQLSSARQATFPLNATLGGGNHLQLGGWFITSGNPGVIFSAVGINGATLSAWDKWQADWLMPFAALKPDMVILEYGTNEAFNDDLDPVLYRRQLEKRIAQIRETLPDAAILLIGPPDSIKNKEQTTCSAREPVSLAKVMNIQKQVAEAQQLLFWDWRAFMGGACSMERWSATGYARPDLVHLSTDGYKKSANALFDQLISLLEKAQ